MSKQPQHVKMNLISDVMSLTGLNRSEATKAVAATYDSVLNALTQGKQVRMDNIGTLFPKAMPERTCRNPATGDTFIREAHLKIAFRPSKVGVDILNDAQEA